MLNYVLNCWHILNLIYELSNPNPVLRTSFSDRWYSRTRIGSVCYPETLSVNLYINY